MPSFDRQEVEAARKRLIAIEDAAMRKADRSIKRGLQTILGEIEAALAKLETGSEGEVLNNLENIRRAQNLLNGLDPAMQAIANDARSEVESELASITTEVNKIVGLAGFKVGPEKANRIDTRILDTFLNLSLDRFNGGASATVQALTDGIFNRMAGQATIKDMVGSIRRIVEGQEDRGGNPMTRHAQTWANSAIATFENQITQQLIPPEEQGALYYAGPVDDATRDFCKEHSGKAYKREEILAEIEAYAAANPSINASPSLPGGWNCRHELIPVPIEEVKSGAVKVEGATDE